MRGLESLIPQKNEKDERVSSQESVFMIEVEKIHPNPYQPRKDFNEEELADLASSIRQFGILQPLIVSKIEKDTPTGRDVDYELIAGERRLRAAKMANLPRVPVVVRRSTAPEKLALSVIENIQRADLSPVEEARAFERLNKEFKMSMSDIAAEVGKSTPVVANAMRMLRLPEDMLSAINARKVPMAHSRFLLMLDDTPEKQKKLFEEMLQRNLDSRAAQERVWEMEKEKEGGAKIRTQNTRKDPELMSIAEKMKDSVGLHAVSVSRIGRRARIVIEFPSKGELLLWMNKVIRS
jgi:ParB family chromosome partitioning protein